MHYSTEPLGTSNGSFEFKEDIRVQGIGESRQNGINTISNLKKPYVVN